MKSSKSERGNLLEGSETCNNTWFEDNSTNKKAGGGVGRA